MTDKYSSFGKQRGNKLWEGNRMILPEHRAYMIEKEINDEMFVARPTLDEDKLAEMSQVLGDAIANARIVTVTLYREHGPERVTMLPVGIDVTTRMLKGRSVLGVNKVSVSLNDMVDVEIDD